jgi:Tfp pilus assembly protein PilZ
MNQIINTYTKVLKGSELIPFLEIPKTWQKKQVEVRVTLITPKKRKFVYAGGSLQKYANPALRKMEKKGIELALTAKHESNRR